VSTSAGAKSRPAATKSTWAEQGQIAEGSPAPSISSTAIISISAFGGIYVLERTRLAAVMRGPGSMELELREE
jgi:hypothetical protein